MKTTLLLLALLLIGCEAEQTGVVYRSMLDVPAKVEIYQDGLIETLYVAPFDEVFVELPIGEIRWEYTPQGCWRVLPGTVVLKEGEAREDSLWFKLPLWN